MKKYISGFIFVLMSVVLMSCSSNIFVVSFDSRGGNVIEAIEVEEGQKILIPEVYKEGYTLDGWYTSANNGDTFDEKWSFLTNNVNNDTVLFANWSLNQYTITFESNLEVHIDLVTQDYNSELDAPSAPTIYGYEFLDWYEDEASTEPFVFTTMPAKNLTLYAKYRLNGLSFDKETGSITDYSGALDKIVIPNEIDGVVVTTIGDYAFKGNNLTSVSIPSSVTTIGDYAFSSNALTSVSIPSSVTTIGERAFDWSEITDFSIESNDNFVYENNLLLTQDQTTVVSGVGSMDSISIPSGVTTIGDYAFFSNALTSVSIPSSVTTIGDYAFEWNALTSVSIPSSVTTIGDYAFFNNALTSVSIPSGVTTIGDYAFSSNALTSVSIPSSVTTIGDYAFFGNYLTSVSILGDETRFNKYWIRIGFPVELKPE